MCALEGRCLPRLRTIRQNQSERAGRKAPESFQNSLTPVPGAHTSADIKRTDLPTLYCNWTDEIIADVSLGNIFAVITPSASECRLDYLQFPMRAHSLRDVLGPIFKCYLFHIQTESPAGNNNVQTVMSGGQKDHAVQMSPCYCEDFPLPAANLYPMSIGLLCRKQSFGVINLSRWHQSTLSALLSCTFHVAAC